MLVESSNEAELALGSPLSLVDTFLLFSILVGTAWWIWKTYLTKQDSSSSRTYTIVPSNFSSAPQPGESSFIKKLQSSGRSLVVFYGSQTGTGEEFASRIAKEGVKYGMKGMVADPEECDMDELERLKEIPNSLAVFCLATYGEGDPTDNAMDFFEWLMNGSASDLAGLNYAVFGLGNKTYEHYNEVAIKVDSRFTELGAHRVCELGLGDDDANIEDDFITWKDKFWPAVCEYFNIESTGDDVSIRQYRLTEHGDDIDTKKVFTGEISRIGSLTNQRPPFDVKNPFLGKVKVNREVHKSGDRSCMHIEFDIDGSKMRYDTGDHLGLYPVNDAGLVNRLGELLNVDLDKIITLTNTDVDSSKKHPFPCPCSYRTALTYYLDITSNPRTHVLKELAEYASDPKEQEILKQMASTSPEGKQLYMRWINEDNRNVIHILEDLPSVKIAIDHLCELLPRLQPRYYSISSSPKIYPTTVHVTAVKVEYTTATNRVNKGVATTWLAAKTPNEEHPPVVPVFIRKSQFRLPTRVHVPIIMIGPGTGFAPFRAFIQERDLARNEGKPVGETVLYYGCRRKSEDFIYEEELREYEKNNSVKVHYAFSRDQPEKVYVTHLLAQNADELWRIIGENSGHLYVCGDARSMAKDVHNIVLKVVREKGGMSEQEAIVYVKKMESQKRYSADVWS